MSGRFDPCTLTVDGKSVRALKIVCGKCSNIEASVANPLSGSRDQQANDRLEQIIARKFANKGWTVSPKTRTGDRCPTCAAKPAPPVENTMPANIIEAPRQMSREDRRIIFEKLNEVYDAERYGAGWTDKRVADDLGTPRAWVEQVRKEMFGDAGDNPEIEAAVADARALLAESKAAVTSIAKLVAPLTDRAERLEKLIRGLEATLR